MGVWVLAESCTMQLQNMKWCRQALSQIQLSAHQSHCDPAAQSCAESLLLCPIYHLRATAEDCHEACLLKHPLLRSCMPCHAMTFHHVALLHSKQQTAKPGAVIALDPCLHNELCSEGMLFDCFTLRAFLTTPMLGDACYVFAICWKTVPQELNLHRFPGIGVPPKVELRAGQI